MTKTATAGFSIIELLIGISITSIVLVASVNLFLSSVSGSTRQRTVSLVKLNGDYIINHIENELRDAVSIQANRDNPQATCKQSMNSLSVISSDNSVKTWYLEDQNLYLEDSSGVVELTATNVDALNLQIDCVQDVSTGSVYINIKILLGIIKDSDRLEDNFQSTYETSVNLRNRD